MLSNGAIGKHLPYGDYEIVLSRSQRSLLLWRLDSFAIAQDRLYPFLASSRLISLIFARETMGYLAGGYQNISFDLSRYCDFQLTTSTTYQTQSTTTGTIMKVCHNCRPPFGIDKDIISVYATARRTGED